MERSQKEKLQRDRDQSTSDQYGKDQEIEVSLLFPVQQGSGD